MRLLIIGTHPSQTTGYSKVVYNIAKQLRNYPNIECSIFGIQKFNKINDDIRLNIAKNVYIWDVYENDKNDYGFGTGSLSNFVIINQPDIILIYNDPEVIKKYIMNLLLIKETYNYKGMNKNFKIVAYLDQVHTNHNIETIKYIAENTEHVFCFTDYWKKNYLSYFNKDLYKNKSSIIKHGIELNNTSLTNEECKEKLGFAKNSFIFLNLNRFAMKKRLDISIIAFVKFLKKTNANNVYLYFPAIVDKDIQLLYNIYNYECKINDINFPNNLIIGNKVLNDEDINNIYMACDVGLNSCDGEGFGLCNYEHASYGKPQIISYVGGLKDYFNENNSLICLPKYISYSNENERGEIIDTEDMAEKMFKYYMNKSLYNKHSNILKEISSKYKWNIEVSNMINILNLIK